jgi:hypothetical protein
VAVVDKGTVPAAAGPGGGSGGGSGGDEARWRTLLRFEVLVVLALSFGQSAI